MKSREIDVLGIGNAIVDVLAQVDDAFLDRQGIVKGSMALIDQQRAKSLYDDMGPGLEVSGGSAANTIAGIASFGGNSAFIGKVRDDQLGEVFIHDIRATHAMFETVPATMGPATARCLVLITPDGERSLNTFLGASIGLAPDDIDSDVVRAAKVTYLEGYLWDPEQAKLAFIKAARTARAAGRQVSLSLSDAFCVDRHRDSFLELIRDEVDILFANEAEIISLYQVEQFDDALQAARQDCKLAALTRSEAGCVVLLENEVHEVSANKVDRVVDATGAGDLFAAGFLYGHTRGLEPVQCAQLGTLAASSIISHIGARSLQPLDQLVKSIDLL